VTPFGSDGLHRQSRRSIMHHHHLLRENVLVMLVGRQQLFGLTTMAVAEYDSAELLFSASGQIMHWAPRRCGRPVPTLSENLYLARHCRDSVAIWR